MHIPPNWGTFFALIVSFLIFWFIFKRLFFDPFLNMLGERERRLRELGERAEHLVKEAKDAEQERDRQLAELRREALARREAERRRAEEQAAHMIEEARAASSRLDGADPGRNRKSGELRRTATRRFRAHARGRPG